MKAIVGVAMRLWIIFLAAATTLAACDAVLERAAPAPESRQQINIPEVQTGLRDLGYYKGGIDGIVGPMTRAAVQHCRTDFGLDPAGGIDHEFVDLLNRYLELNPPRTGAPRAADVFTVQRGLKRLGYYDGKATGAFDGTTLAAVLVYKRDSGLPISEAVDTRLLRRIKRDLSALPASS